MDTRRSLPQALVLAAVCIALAPDGLLAQEQQRRARRPPESRIVPQEGFEAAGPDIADLAPDFLLADTEGGKVRLSDLWTDKALLLVLGSCTAAAHSLDRSFRLAGCGS